MEQIAQKNHFKCEQTDMYQYTSAVSIKTKGGEWGGGGMRPPGSSPVLSLDWGKQRIHELTGAEPQHLERGGHSICVQILRMWKTAFTKNF